MTQKIQTGRSRHREKAISALLSTSTITDAAAQSGISLSTLKRWLATPEFAAELKAARNKFLQDTMTATTKALVDASLSSVETLKGIAGNPFLNESARTSAAKAVIEFAYKSGLYAELEHKIEQLEGNNDAKE
jgi:hypothetical protein